jgi:predicted glycosyltransferase
MQLQISLASVILGPSECCTWKRTPFGTKDIRRESILEYRKFVNNNPIFVMDPEVLFEVNNPA